MGEIIRLPAPEQMTPEQRQHWHEQAAYWGCRQDDLEVAMEYATKQRNHALQMLGMLTMSDGVA